MKRYVSDTQCIIWYFAEEEHRMPKAARGAFKDVQDGTAQVLVPSIALVEAVFLAERQRVPSAILGELLSLSDAPTESIRVIPLDLAVARTVADFGPASVPELADRIIAATARTLNLPLLTTDPVIVASGLVKVAK